LAAIDGSEQSEKAGYFAVDLARIYNARLMLLYVVHHPLRYLGRTTSHEVAVGLPLPTEQTEGMKKRSSDSIDRIASVAAYQKVPTRKEFFETELSIVDAIAGYAENESAQIIVVGVRGLSNFDPYVVGSVASGLVARAHCSLLIVR